jgi:PhzF family phenazine biosynthesis protein
MPRAATASSRAGRLLIRRNTIRVKHIDVFTETPMTGNPCCVVTDAVGLSEKTMQSIAREMSAPATAFVLPPKSIGADMRMRWFSPLRELNLCGHGAIASLIALSQERKFGLKGVGSHSRKIETSSGILPVTVEISPAGVEAFLGLSPPQFVPSPSEKLDLMRVLNIGINEFDRSPIVVSGECMYVPLRRLLTLFSLKPRNFTLSQFLINRKLIGLSVFTGETLERQSSFHSRFFAPTVGIPEDPVTGTAGGAIAVYLFQQDKLTQQGETIHLVGEQGDCLERRGRVFVRLTTSYGKVRSVFVGGTGVLLWDAEMRVQ